MDITIVAIILGTIGALISIIVSIINFRQKSDKVEFTLPKSSKKSKIKIDQGRVSANIMVGAGNKISISGSNHISDKEIGNLIENISVKDKNQKVEDEE